MAEIYGLENLRPHLNKIVEAGDNELSREFNRMDWETFDDFLDGDWSMFEDYFTTVYNEWAKQNERDPYKDGEVELSRHGDLIAEAACRIYANLEHEMAGDYDDEDGFDYDSLVESTRTCMSESWDTIENYFNNL